MAEEGEDDGDLPIVNFEAVSEDEITANASDENDADREARRARNRARTIRRRRANERRRSMHCELDPEFAAVSERGFRTPVANIARVTAILERSHDPEVRQALLYAQRAWIQLDQHNLASTIREEGVGESRSQAHSRTAGGRPRHQLSNDNARGSQAAGRRQQPPQGGHPRQANHRLLPDDLRQHINEGRDTRTVISSRRKVREEVETEGTDCSDRFPAFSARFGSYKYPEGFKPIGITKYDGKQAPQQWLRCYSTAIEVAGGSNITKVVYLPMALDPAPLTWLGASATTQSTPGSASRRSSSTTSRERLLVQVLIMILLSVSKNVMSFCDPTHVASSTSAPPSRTSRRTTSSIVSTTASPTRASTGISGGTGQRLLRAFVI
jgi:hypothetical protein